MHGTADFQDDFRNYRELVFAVGDSFTEGIGTAPDQSYPFQFDLLLNLQGPPNHTYTKAFGVVNLGVGGHGTRQALLRLREYAERPGHPQYVLVIGSDNDATDDAYFDGGYAHRHFVDNSPHCGVLAPVIRFLDGLQSFGTGRRQRHGPWTDPFRRRTTVAAMVKILVQARTCGATVVLSWANPTEA